MSETPAVETVRVVTVDGDVAAVFKPFCDASAYAQYRHSLMMMMMMIVASLHHSRYKIHGCKLYRSLLNICDVVSTASKCAVLSRCVATEKKLFVTTFNSRSPKQL